MVERVRVEGLSELKGALEALPKSVGKSVIRRVRGRVCALQAR